MTLPRFALQYYAYKKDELRAFIGSRTGSTPSKSRTKMALIERLQDLDKKATFRFMDLAPELRNMVYREVLTLKSSERIEKDRKSAWKQNQGRWTAILRVSSHIHTEAKDILYGDTEVTVKLEFSKLFHCTIVQYDQAAQPLSIYLIGQENFGFADFLRRVQRLRISVEYPNACASKTEVKQSINRLLYSLATHLQSSTAIKTVAVNLTMGSAEPAFEPHAKRMLWPLVRLGKSRYTTITGNQDESDMAKVEAYLNNAEVTTSYKPFREYVDLVEKATAYKEAAKFASCRIPDSFAGRFEHCKSLVCSMETITSLHEQMLGFSVKALEDILTIHVLGDCAQQTYAKACRMRLLALRIMDEEVPDDLLRSGMY